MTEHQKRIAALDRTDQFYSAIGRFIDEFSFLEMALKCWIAEQLGLSSEQQDIILTHDFAMTCAIAQKLFADGATKENKDKFRKLVGKCHDLNQHRVRIVHGFWFFGHSSGTLTHVSRRTLAPESYYRNPDEIAALADEAWRLNQSFSSLAVDKPAAQKERR
jgi:hypothetical protein